MKKNVKLIRGTTCLDVWMKQDTLYPVRPTSTFYINDSQICLFAELIGVQHDCPVIVTWHHEGVLVHGSMATIPVSKDLHQFHRTYAAGFYLNPEVSTGQWMVTLHLVTGRELFQQKFQILDRERLYYRPYNENYTRGRIFDERVE